jgi:hypothetical protein
MSTLAKKQTPETIAPSVHLEFIQNQAGLPEGEGLHEIESYHRALFLHHHAGEIEQFKQQSRIHESRLSHLENRMADTQSKLTGVDKLIPVNLDGQPDIKPGMPWNTWDCAMFAAALVGIAALLIFGVLNISFNLLESGLVTFVESRIRAYFWAALLPIGALGVKVGWDLLESTAKRKVYLWACLIAGLAGVLTWVAAYAAVYPTLSKTTTEQIQSLSVFDTTAPSSGIFSAVAPGGAKWIDIITVAGQAVAEIFLSAVLGIYMTVIYSRHRPVRLAGNPLFMQLDEERRSLEESIARERVSLAEAMGNQSRLENQLSALLSYARSLFQKESALRQDQSHQKRLFLDQISEQLRTQLQTVENGHAERFTNPPPALTSRNGQ